MVGENWESLESRMFVVSFVVVFPLSQSLSVSVSLYHPDITVLVKWALKTKFLPFSFNCIKNQKGEITQEHLFAHIFRLVDGQQDHEDMLWAIQGSPKSNIVKSCLTPQTLRVKASCFYCDVIVYSSLCNSYCIFVLIVCPLLCNSTKYLLWCNRVCLSPCLPRQLVKFALLIFILWLLVDVAFCRCCLWM